MSRLTLVLGALLVVGAPGTQAASSSTFTAHDFTACRLASNDGIIETRACPGYAGIPVLWFGEPDGSAISFGRRDHGSGLGESFTDVGRNIEWRGPMRAASIAPIAAIVRVDVGQTIAGPVRRRLLVVHKLLGRAGSCIAAVIDAGKPDGRARARKAADLIVPGFRCGTDVPKAI